MSKLMALLFAPESISIVVLIGIMFVRSLNKHSNW